MTDNTPQLLARAAAARADRNLAESDRLYREILARDERHHESWHGLALNGLARDRYDIAVAMADKAIAIESAIAAYHNTRGAGFERMGRPELAAASYRRALAITPNDAALHATLGLLYGQQGKLAEAVAAFTQSLALAPDDKHVQYNLGFANEKLGRYDDAIAAYQRTLALEPNSAEAWMSLGKVLFAVNRLEESLTASDRALALKPGHADAWNNRGTALFQLDRPAEALESYDRAMSLSPANALNHVNRANALVRVGRLPEALPMFARAQALNPDFAEAHWSESLCRLRMGDMPKGWEKYEWRWRVRPETARAFASHLWLGDEMIAGKSILIHGEQGFGDCIHFCRYVPMVAERGAKVVLEVPRELTRLMAGLKGVSEIRTQGEPLPETDFHCPLASLPLAFRTSPDTIPAAVPYLKVPPHVAAHWRDRLANLSRPRIGLNWVAGARHWGELHRSIAPETLAPLRDCGATLVSLQQNYRREDSAWLAANPTIHDFGAEITDFADTAAIAREMDLVISVDTAVAHLAGALALPVWILLSYIGDWRWLTERSDSPWYPTAKLYRQAGINDWAGVIARVTDDVKRGLPESVKR
ncbi:MAG: tetratricopeptide repeat-containing glycosyltransferase family protein [Rhodospirillaceae bacterium]|nr:tetratricopeptide repeat-containing glycosyltransferase family protein [Rhodospirillaceae bacterium]